MPREILGNALTAKRTQTRLYATQFMLVLLRARMQNFEVWGLPMLVNQTKDVDRTVAMTALEILDESCHERVSSFLINFHWNCEPFDSVPHWP